MLHTSFTITFNYPTFFSEKPFLFLIHKTFSRADVFMMDHMKHRSYIYYCTSHSYNSIHEQIHREHWHEKQTTFPKWSNFIPSLYQQVIMCRRHRMRKAMPDSLEISAVRLSRCCDRIRCAEGPMQSQDHPPVQFPPEVCQNLEITQPRHVCAPRWAAEHSQISTATCYEVSSPNSSPFFSLCI